MNQNITWVGLDTSKKQHSVAILDPHSRTPRMSDVQNEVRALKRFARKLVREAPGEVRLCYEAGPCGFILQRQLEAAAPELTVEVIAPSLIPIQPGMRIKTDPRDARKLAKLYRADQLTAVHAPSQEQESVRDLVRCREDAKQDLMRSRHRLKKFLLRRGYIFREGTSWTQKYHRWLAGLRWENDADRMTYESYWLQITQLQDRGDRLTHQITVIAQEAPYAEPVGWLRCFRGIDTVTAMTIIVELHDIGRFGGARKLTCYLGLVPSENSSGDRTRRGGITKAGNGHVRRVLVEASWSSRHKPMVGFQLRQRRKGQPDWVIVHADRAMSRLSDRYRRLTARGKPYNKVIIAVAREFVGFLLAVLTEGEMRKQNGCQS